MFKEAIDKIRSKFDIGEPPFDYNVLMISPSFEAKERVSESIMSATLINSIRGDDIPVSFHNHKF